MKLASEISDIDQEFKFTQPNDNVRLEHCIITFPDGASIPFPVISEHYTNDTKTITISSTPYQTVYSNDDPIARINHQTTSRYIKLYGGCIQFESFKEYRFVRMYNNIQDLYDHTFDGFIYDDKDDYGFSEIFIQFTKSRYSINTSKSIVKQSNFLHLDQAILIKEMDSDYKKNLSNYAIKFTKKIEELGFNIDKSNIGTIFVTEKELPLNIPNPRIGLVGYLYLAFVNGLIPKSDILVKILNHGDFDSDDIIVTLYDRHSY